MIKLEIGEEEIKHLSQSLRKVSFFSNLTMADLDKVLNVTHLYAYKTGRYLFKKGDVGEMALLNQPYRTASVKTMGPTKLFVLLNSYFNSLLRDNPSFKKSIGQMAEFRKFESDRIK